MHARRTPVPTPLGCGDCDLGRFAPCAALRWPWVVCGLQHVSGAPRDRRLTLGSEALCTSPLRSSSQRRAARRASASVGPTRRKVTELAERQPPSAPASSGYRRAADNRWSISRDAAGVERTVDTVQHPHVPAPAQHVLWPNAPSKGVSERCTEGRSSSSLGPRWTLPFPRFMRPSWLRCRTCRRRTRRSPFSARLSRGPGRCAYHGRSLSRLQREEAFMLPPRACAGRRVMR